MTLFGNAWDDILKDELEKEYYKDICSFLESEYAGDTDIYPEANDIFNALKITDYHSVKAVILGQDPYHGQGQAHGLSFSVKDPTTPPPSLKNIFKEYQSDTGYEIPKSGDLSKWAKNGVLLLNSLLTVRAGQPASHSRCGWEKFTDRIIQLLNMREQPIVFILWGNFAKGKAKLITNPQHHILTAPHPSPLSAYHGFFGSKPFSKTNELLASPIDWRLD